MASNQTQNYALPQWKGTDTFSMAEFNDTFAKIDTAIASAHSKATAAEQRCENAIAQGLKLVTGTYTGNGDATRKISLGVTPKLVYVALNGIMIFENSYRYGGIALTNHPTTNLTIVTGGFEVQNNNDRATNVNGATYFYFALA